MQAIIIATNGNPSLAPIVEQGCAGLLPLGGKLIIEYAIEALRKLGVRQALVVSRCNEATVRASLGDGSRWGMHLGYALPEQVDAMCNAYFANNDGETIVVPGDAFWQMDLDAFCRRARQSSDDCYMGTYKQHVIATWYQHLPTQGVMHALSLEQHGQCQHAHQSGTYYLPVQDFKTYFNACMALVNGQLPPAMPSGRPAEPGVYVEVGAKLPALKHDKLVAAFVGKDSQVNKAAKLEGIAVIERNVVIDRGASVENSVILPNTYVGQMMRVSNSIVSGNILVNLRSGTVMRVEDSLMLAAL